MDNFWTALLITSSTNFNYLYFFPTFDIRATELKRCFHKKPWFELTAEVVFLIQSAICFLSVKSVPPL